MPKLIHPLLMLIAQATEKELVLYIEYLKAENRILRSKLPKRINVTPAERPHSAAGYLPPGLAKPPDEVKCLGPKDVVVRERLGGLLRYYERRAA